MKNPKPTQEQILHACQKTAGKSVWAIALTTDEFGKHIWEAFCEDKKNINKIPKSHKGQTIKAVFCEKPNFTAKKNFV